MGWRTKNRIFRIYTVYFGRNLIKICFKTWKKQWKSSKLSYKTCDKVRRNDLKWLKILRRVRRTATDESELKNECDA